MNFYYVIYIHTYMHLIDVNPWIPFSPPLLLAFFSPPQQAMAFPGCP